MLDGLLFVLRKAQAVHQRIVALDNLRGGESCRNACGCRVVVDQVNDAVDGPVHGPAVFVLAAEVVAGGRLLIFRHMQRVVHQFLDALSFRGGDRNDGDAEQSFHPVDVDGSAVAPHLVHHVERQHHGNVEFHQLHRQIQAAFDAGSVQDVDDAFGLLLQDEFPGDDLLAGIRGERVDTGQIRDEGLGMSFDDPVS